MIRISLAAVITLAIGFSLYVMKATKPPDSWFEVVNDDLIRVAAPEHLIARCIGDVLHRRQNLSLEGQRLVNPSFNQQLHVWQQGFLDSKTFERLRVLTIDQVDEQGCDMRIERWDGCDMPTLILLSYSGDDGPAVLTSELASELTRRGVRERS
jgi:hypothetical protein